MATEQPPVAGAYRDEHGFWTVPLPEHEKLKALEGKNEAVGDFLSWLFRRGYVICRDRAGGDFLAVEHASVETWIARYYGIDQAALMREKEHILDLIRAQQR